jgi:uncharacterized protein YbaR (Trm112 family)
MNIPADLLEILACPSCHAPLRANEPANLLECGRCGLRYPVRDDIPVLLIDEALPPATAGEAGEAAADPGARG